MLRKHDIFVHLRWHKYKTYHQNSTFLKGTEVLLLTITDVWFVISLHEVKVSTKKQQPTNPLKMLKCRDLVWHYL